MEKKTSRNLFFASVGLIIVAAILFFVAGGTVDQTTGALTGGNSLLRSLGLVAYGIGAIVSLVATIGALVKLAKLNRWGWFVGVLLTGIGFLIYIFAGPTEKRA